MHHQASGRTLLLPIAGARHSPLVHPNFVLGQSIHPPTNSFVGRFLLHSSQGQLRHRACMVAAWAEEGSKQTVAPSLRTFRDSTGICVQATCKHTCTPTYAPRPPDLITYTPNTHERHRNQPIDRSSNQCRRRYGRPRPGGGRTGSIWRWRGRGYSNGGKEQQPGKWACVCGSLRIDCWTAAQGTKSLDRGGRILNPLSPQIGV